MEGNSLKVYYLDASLSIGSVNLFSPFIIEFLVVGGFRIVLYVLSFFDYRLIGMLSIFCVIMEMFITSRVLVY